MPDLNVNGRAIAINEDGFLLDPEVWDEEVAGALAKAEEGIAELSDEHWHVIRYIREYFLEKDLAPMVRKVCKNTGFSLKHIFELFPSGPAKGACKLAGLPKPDGCV